MIGDLHSSPNDENDRKIMLKTFHINGARKNSLSFTDGQIITVNCTEDNPLRAVYKLRNIIN